MEFSIPISIYDFMTNVAGSSYQIIFICRGHFSDVHLENVSHFTDQCCTLYQTLSTLSGKCITFY